MLSLAENPQAIVDALGFICKRRKKAQLLPILEAATATIEDVDHFNNTTSYRVDLEIPFELFIDLGPDKEKLETVLSEYAKEVVDGSSGEYVSHVKFAADLSRVGNWRSGESPLQAGTSDVARLWKEGHFRLFLSHSSANKEFGAELKESLGKVKVDVFVAHEDIEPNLTWQQEIKLALASCHALLFLATETSNQSWWCQQEVGWGLGRGVLVTSYMLEKEPVGFANGLQGWKVRKHDVLEIRKKLLTMFAKDDRTEPSMHEPLVQLVQASKTAEQIDYALDYLELLKSLSQSDLERISTVTSQPFVAKSKELRARMQAVLVNFGYSPAVAATPAVDEYDPFADD